MTVGAAALAAVAFWLGSLNVDTAAGSTTTVTTPVLAPALASVEATSTTLRPATLGERVPNLDVDWIGIAFVDDRGRLHHAIWGIASLVPAIDGINQSQVLFTEPEWVNGSLSADGRVFAYSDGRSGLVVANTTIVGGVANWSWHPEESSLAWISQVLGTDTSALYVHDLMPRSEPGIAAREVRRFPSVSGHTWWSTAAYTTTGFVISGSLWDMTQGHGSITLILDEEGEVLDALGAAAVAGASNGIALLHGDVVQGPIPPMVKEFARTLAPDIPVRAIESGWWLRLPTGDLQPVSLRTPEQTGPTTDEPGRHEMILLTPSGDAVVLFHQFGSYRTVEQIPTAPGGPSAYVRIDSGREVRPLGLSRDGRWAILGGDHLVLVDLETATAHELPFDPGTIVAVGF